MGRNRADHNDGRHFREWRAPRAGRPRSQPRSIGAFLRPAAEGIRRWRFLRHDPHSCTWPNTALQYAAYNLPRTHWGRDNEAGLTRPAGKADMPAAGRPASARDRRFFVVSRRVRQRLSRHSVLKSLPAETKTQPLEYWLSVASV